MPQTPNVKGWHWMLVGMLPKTPEVPWYCFSQVVNSQVVKVFFHSQPTVQLCQDVN